jgi:glycosyltransferase involved in cell wall biosynthesis
MIKVVHLISNSDRSAYFCAIADYHDRGKFEIIVVTLTAAGDLHEDMETRGVRSLGLGCRSRLDYAHAILKLAFLLRKERVDVVQTHLFDASFVGLLAARIARIPLIVLTRHHSTAVILTAKRVPMLIDLLCSRYLCHRIIVPSEETKEVLIESERVAASKVVVIPYGFDFEKIQPGEGARERVRRELNLNDALVFAVVGRLDPLKGHAYLFRALAMLTPMYPDIRLLVIGDGPERERLVHLCHALGLTRQVIFTGYRRDIFDVMSAADALIHPSLSESFGQVIVEAAALGKPVVATEVGCAREVVEEGVTGFLVTPGDEKHLVQALLKLLARRDQWQEMGKMARLRVQQFSAERMVKAYEEHYVKWLNERGFIS